ncbi:hypothetical protein [Variovorax sp. PAMC 28711]|uniref:hypothetical protein n=1 Tax=Variovorax sp. PAMC 28711 TaxID=1795631 RepID=UPI00078B74EA|nr:hypothetical protein [Variovorax sp. PAMC 28711]AMM24617.1 hypothetical protein AX767_09840 [Variovorax sp. PAMC 28711]
MKSKFGSRTPCAAKVRRLQQGQASVEYAIAAVFVCLVLFTGNPSLLELMLSALRDSHSASAYAIGSPTVGSAIKK